MFIIYQFSSAIDNNTGKFILLKLLIDLWCYTSKPLATHWLKTTRLKG